MVRRRKEILSVADRLGLQISKKRLQKRGLIPFLRCMVLFRKNGICRTYTAQYSIFVFERYSDSTEIQLDKFYQADFIIPSAKIIIEVQGAFWHSKPATIDSDAYKFALYEVSGYTASLVGL